jgi:hypothetical protein
MTRPGQLVVTVATLALLAGCSSATDGPLDIPTSDGATVTLIAESGPRERAIGNIRATNTGDDEVTITRITLVDPSNVRLGHSVVIPMTANGRTLGSGFPVPPTSTDQDYDRLAALWATSEPAIGAVVEPGQQVDLVVGLEQVDKSRCASLDATTVTYTAGGRTYRDTWGTTYDFTTLDGTRCG